VWKDFLRKQIEELRAQEKQLNEQLAGNNQLIMKGILDKGEYNKEKASLKAQIAETQKEIQAKEAELKCVQRAGLGGNCSGTCNNGSSSR